MCSIQNTAERDWNRTVGYGKKCRKIQKGIVMSLRKKKVENYISVRMKQLAERDKAHDEHDRAWFNRCIQELDWVLQVRNQSACQLLHEQRTILAEICIKRV